MLSYQHSYHAGNFADVLKHIVLCQVLSYQIQKPKPLCYIDTHAGRGLYQLDGIEAQKNGEFQTGIGQLWDLSEVPSSVKQYLNIVKEANSGAKLRRYPGSPWLANYLLRRFDRLFFYELHPAEYHALSSTKLRGKAFKADGLLSVLSLLPPLEHRGVIMIDPSYELANDYRQVVDSIQSMLKHFAIGCYLLWYPIVLRKQIDFLERNLKKLPLTSYQLYELGIQADNQHMGMTGCGIIAINAPWTLEAEMQQALPWLANTLGMAGQGYYRIEKWVSQ